MFFPWVIRYDHGNIYYIEDFFDKGRLKCGVLGYNKLEPIKEKFKSFAKKKTLVDFDLEPEVNRFYSLDDGKWRVLTDKEVLSWERA